MGEVIQLNVRACPKNRLEFLFMCKKDLVIEDYEEILLSIMDKEYYDRADNDIKAIVDNYFMFEN
jgi:hypothetical protein